jgi:[protein-PII] uridylyltransferase
MQKEIETLRHKFREGRSELFRGVKRDSSCRDLLQAHTLLVDEILKDIYEASCRAADRKAVRSGCSGLAIVATGGYGRMELNPYSDIDIAFIPSEEEDPWVEALIHTAFKLVMDVFLSLREVHVGYAFRPLTEANAWDVKTKTALLDLRHICGSIIAAGSYARVGVCRRSQAETAALPVFSGTESERRARFSAGSASRPMDIQAPAALG